MPHQCDGARPVCGACVRRKKDSCDYPVREGAISRYSDLKETSEQLGHENYGLRELFAYIRFRPEKEAYEVYRRLRLADDPLAILEYIRSADALLMMPSSTGPDMIDRRVEDIDAAALAGSPIKVHARPWTVVASDGLVSSLISAFFKWDDPFVFCFIDRELFLRDMRSREPRAQYCSPFLVNAICGLRAVATPNPYKLLRTHPL
jgi:hypothetical protein